MERTRSGLAIIVKYYRLLAIIFLNSVIFFVLINLAADAYLDAIAYFQKTAAMKGTPYSYRRFQESLVAVHPDLSRDQIGTLIAETRKITQGYEPYTQFKENPYRSEFVTVDQRGFRPIKNQAPWPPPKGELTIFVFGGSTTFGYGVADELTIASQMQERLRKTGSAKANVYNFGRGSYMSIQERILFETLLMKGFVPDIAIFIDGLNDLCYADGEPARTKDLKKFMAEGDTSPTQKVLGQLPVTRALRILVSGEAEDSRTGRDKAAGLTRSEILKSAQKVINRYRDNKKITEAVSKAFGVKSIFVWQPIPIYKYDGQFNIFRGFDYHGWVPMLKPAYEIMAKLAASKALGRNFVWTADIQEDQKKPLYVDAVHYSGEMSGMLAHDIVDAIKSRRLIMASN
jgi:lysophospholipase L1-like esterase